MIILNLLIAAVAIYFLGVYLAYFIFGVLGKPDEIDVEVIVWLWPLVLTFLFIEKMGSVAQRWAARLKPIMEPFSRFLRKSIFFLSLPFRPFLLGRFVRERLHLS